MLQYEGCSEINETNRVFPFLSDEFCWKLAKTFKKPQQIIIQGNIKSIPNILFTTVDKLVDGLK